ncbi:MAG: hypothetical protein F4Y95_04300 [Chloroflexi bacterium]|nr:hypothetical protein [Chloroflexota bacterium]
MSKSRGMTKAELARAVTQHSNVAATDVDRVLESLTEVVLAQLSPEGPGVVTLAGLVRAEVAPLPERSERAGRNPATGEPITIAARPARSRGKVRLRPLKPLRDVL